MKKVFRYMADKSDGNYEVKVFIAGILGGMVGFVLLFSASNFENSETIGSWLGSIATFSAVFVSLYLAKRTKPSDLIISGGASLYDDTKNVIVNLYISNLGGSTGFRISSINILFVNKEGKIVHEMDDFGSTLMMPVGECQRVNILSREIRYDTLKKREITWIELKGNDTRTNTELSKKFSLGIIQEDGRDKITFDESPS